MKRVSSGFTLLEMMLVLIVIGLTASLIIATLPADRESLDSESARLMTTMQLMQERAVEENRIYGLRLTEHGWQVLELQPDKAATPGWDSQLIAGSHWQLLYQRGKAVACQLPASMTLTVTLEQSQLQIGSSEKSADALEPTLLFFPGGELTYFEITMSDSRQKRKVVIALSPQGEIDRKADET